jgi:hypothetical protein
MPYMPTPLHFSDPTEIGPFRLESRLHESAAGIVYLGADSTGRAIEVALLTTAAAGDPAARDRFRAAVRAESPQHGLPVDAPTAQDEGEGPLPVLAAFTDGEAPWVATAHQEGRSGAQRFLEPVLLSRGWGVRRRGPQFQPYWLSGPRGPALQAPEPAPALAVEGDDRGLATAVIALAALLAMLVLLVLLLFSCEPSEPKPPVPTDVPTSQPQQPVPEPTPSQPSTTPSRTISPVPRPTGGQDTINPADA